MILTLPFICSTKIFYVVNNLLSPNLTCYRDNEIFQPCSTFEVLHSKLYYQNINTIYLLDHTFQISGNLYLHFSSHHKVEIKTWSNSSLSTLSCIGGNFSMAFSGIKEVIIQSIQFLQCGGSSPLIMLDTGGGHVKLVKVINVTFNQSGQSSLQIVSDICELQVIDSTFTAGRNDVDINFKGKVLKATFKGTTFSHSRLGSLITHGFINESTLSIQNCTFFNNVVADINIQLYSLHSVVIKSSHFEENFAYDFIQVENVINMSITSSYFRSNIVQNGLFLHLGCAFLIFDNSFIINNTAINSDGVIMLENCLQASFRKCIFQKNVANGNGSTLTISESSLTVINGTTFEENQALSEGGAVTGRSINDFYIYRCNFTNNLAESGGALNITGKFIVIQNSNFKNNTAKKHGGGLQIHGQIINITESHYFNNTALGSDGGAISVTCNVLHVASSNFSSNKAARRGGAISTSIEYKGYSFFYNTIFERNHAKKGNGGAIVTVLSEIKEIVTNHSILNTPDVVNFTVVFSTFNNNSAQSGGAISSNGIVVVIESSNFSSNSALFDGGALIVYTKSTIIVWCIFRENYAGKYDGDGGALRTSGIFLSISQSFFYTNGADIGGGLSIIQNNLTKICSSKFIHNEATRGGSAINIVSVIILELHSCDFDMNRVISNKLFGHGGAIKIYSLMNFATFETNFTSNFNGAILIEKNDVMTILWSCLFFNNTSDKHGGAVWVTKKDVKLIFIANCVFRNNSAKIGGAIAFDAYIDSFSTKPCSSTFFDKVDDIINEISVIVQKRSFSNSFLVHKSNYFKLTVISNCTFSYNTAKDGNSKGGALSVQSSKITPTVEKIEYDQLVITDSTLIGNNAKVGGGIYCFLGKIFVRNVLFNSNAVLHYGGGVALEQSGICFTGNVSFIANKVTSKQGKGGALYSNDRGKDCKENSCPVLWTKQSSLKFVENSAKEGPALFGGLLNQCDNFPEKSFKSALKRLQFDNMLYNWNSYAITSSGIKLCLNISCKREVRKSISPGQSFTVTVACLDQMELPLNNCVIKSDGYESAKFQLDRGEYRRSINGFEELTFHLYSNIINSTSLIIYSELLCSESAQNKLEVYLDVQRCPIGFYLDQMECICDYRLKATFKNIECNIKNESLYTSSGWISYKGNSLRMNGKCPLNYCLKQRSFISPLQSDVQCANNRGGVLCGRCLANYSVVLGSWKCMACSHSSSYNFIWLTVVMALAGLVLVIFLWLVKMTVSSGTINGLIFHANILSFSGLLDHQNCAIHPFLHVFISWINLDLDIEVCFYSGLDVYQKTWLQFVFPFYIWFLVGVIILVCHYSSSVMKLMGMRNIEVLATLFLLSYAKLLKTIVTALSVTNIMVASADNITDPLRPHKVWVYDGNIDYFGPKHLPLFIVSVLFLFMLFMPYTMFLLCGQWLQRVPRKRGLRWVHSTFISTIMDAYHAPYTKHHRYWTGLGLLIRCCLFTIFGASYSTGINLVFIIVAVILLQVIRIASSGKLYRNKVVGLLELFYLSNLEIVAAVLLINDTPCAAISVSISLSFTVFAGTLLYHLHHEVKSNSLYKTIKKRIYEVVFIIKTKYNTSDKKEKKNIPEQKATTGYFQLRESLIDST